MNKEEIQQLLESEIISTLENNPDIKELMVSQKVVMWGDYLATIVFNKLFGINKPLPRIDLYHQENYPCTRRVITTTEYVLLDIDCLSIAQLATSNFKCICAFYDTTNELMISVSDHFIELVQTKQLQFCTTSYPGLMLCDLISTFNNWKDYLFLNKEQLYQVYSDLSYIGFTTRVNKDKAEKAEIPYLEYMELDKPNSIYYADINSSRLLPDHVLNYIRDNKFSETINPYRTFFDLLYGAKVKKYLKELRLEILKYPQLTHYLVFNLNYLDNLANSWKDKLPGLNKLLAEHDLHHLFQDLTLNKQLSLYSEIDNLIKKHGLWIIGLLENQDSYDKQAFIKTIQLKKLQNSKWLVEPVNIDKTKLPFGLGNKWEIQELYTRQLLIEEGEYQHHCVGGYNVSDNHRIFSIRQGEFRYTVEMQIDSGRNWIIKQAQAKYRKLLNSFSEEVQNDVEAILTWLKSELPVYRNLVKDSASTLLNDFL